MIARSLWVALAAGLFAGLVAAAVQGLAVTPLILEAEQFEHGHAPDADGAAGVAWTPADGVERGLYTVLANGLTGVGFGFLVVAAYLVRGRRVGWRQGALWGLAGFGVFALAPALGLPPELPGVAAADLGARQIWWLGTVAATAVGLAALVFSPRLTVKAAGLLVVALPHLIGAPAPPLVQDAVPAVLAAQFAVASLAANAAFWLVLGAAAGLLFDRWVEDRTAPAA